MDLMTSFSEKEVTPVYIMVDAIDQLLLSEGIYNLFGIVEYHPHVEVSRGGHKRKSSGIQPASIDRFPCAPTVRVTSVKVLPHQSVIVPIEVVGICECYMSTRARQFRDDTS